MENDTVWLTQAQMAELFGASRTNIVEHISHIFAEGELEEAATCRNFRQVRQEGQRQVARDLPFYNLDMILSVGYRVKSKTATRFRIWATKVLREHIVKGYTVNETRLAQLKQTVQILARSAIPEIAGTANILMQFASGLDLLDQYDHQSLQKPKLGGKRSKWELTYEEARKFVDSMKFGNDSSLFGAEKDDSFKSSLGAIYQSFGGQDLYPTLQEKAANLLYFVVKNHSFTDGNKRIAAALFIYFLSKQKLLYKKDGLPVIDNSTLAAMTLMIALSRPDEKETMVKLVLNFMA
jgi:prophage maintenance system killer protein